MGWALVTGAGIRVGRAIALQLAKEGCDLVLHANSSVSALESLAVEVEGLGRKTLMLTADLGDRTDRDRWIEEVRGEVESLDLLVNNAAIYDASPLKDIDYPQWDRMMAVNLEAPFFIIRGFIDLLRRGQAPLVVNITDSGLNWPDTGYSHYFAAKSGLAMLTRVLALELAPEVRVNAVAPGTVAFPPDFDAVQREEIVAQIPMEKIGTPEDIAQAVSFLYKAGDFVTGQTLSIDGGRSAC